MNAIVIATRKKVRKFLKNMYGETYAIAVSEVDDAFILRRGSADVRVSVRPLTEEDCIVEAVSYVVQGAKITSQLMNFLLRQNSVNPFGAFSLIFDDTVVYKHCIMGAHLDLNEFRTTVRTVAFVADEMDDVIRTMSGGKRAADVPAAVKVKAAPKKAAPKKAAPKKAAPKKAAPKKAAPKKAAPKKAAPKKAAPKKAAPKKAAPKKAARRK
jgi:hypothetical protein